MDVEKRCKDALILSAEKLGSKKKKNRVEMDQQFGERSSVAEYAATAFSG